MRLSFPRLAFLVVATSAGCAAVIGFPDYTSTSSSSGGGATGGGATSASASTSTTSSTSASSGTGGAATCVEGAACYLGLDGTQGVGTCVGGTQSCDGGVAVCNDVRPAIQACGDAGVADTNCDGFPGCTGQVRWSHAGFMANVAGVAAGRDGTIALAGVSTGTPGAFVATFDAHGRPCWPAPAVFNGGGTLGVKAVAVSGAKVGADGNVAQAICPGGLAARTVVVGNATGTVTFGQGAPLTADKTDGFVAVLDPQGKVAWGTLFGSAGNDDIRAVATGKSGEIYLTGSIAGPLDALPCAGMLDGGILPSDGGDEDGGDAGDGGDGGAPPGGVIVAKLEPDGTCDWVDVFPGAGEGTGISVDGDGKVALAGTVTGVVSFNGTIVGPSPGIQAFIVRLFPDGGIDGNVLGLGCSPTYPPFVAASPLPSPNSDIFALCINPPGGSCGGMAGDPTRSILAHVDTHLNALPFTCFTSPTAGAAVNARGLTIDGAGNVIVLAVATGPVQSAGFSTPIPTASPSNLVTFKLASPYAGYAWATAWGSGVGFGGAGVAVDGMGDVVVGVSPMGAVSAGPVVLPAGGASVVELSP